MFFVFLLLILIYFFPAEFVPEADRATLFADLEANPFVNLLEEFSSNFKRDKHLQNSDSFRFIQPREVKLKAKSGGKDSSYQYIPVPDLLAVIMKDLGDRSVKPDQCQGKDVLQHILEGSAWRENDYFINNKDAIPLLLYSDEFEPCNPIGQSRSKQKILNIYMAPACLPKHLLSKTENWYLVVCAKSKDLKEHREDIYAALIGDLKKLEDGVEVDGTVLKAGILAYISDNLEAHTVGGFSGGFASKQICRFCHQLYEDLPETSGVPTARPWTRAEYDGDREKVNSGEKSEFGLKLPCIFNELRSFHSVGQFAADIMHDFWEKVGPCDGLSALKSLIADGVLTLEEYNFALSQLSLSGYETSDQLSKVLEKSEKLPGKAMAVCLHLRVMPFLLWGILGDDPEMSAPLTLILLLYQINEFLLADSINYADISNFEELLVEFFAVRKVCSEQYSFFCKIAPKHHYLTHLTQEMEKYGPPFNTSTARCESKHQDFINFSESSKNFINITKTLAVKNQKKLASR